MKAFEHKHVVGFEETNVVGNVYFANYLVWQGKCREMFLRTHCPSILGLIAEGLSLVTLRTNCEYFAELEAFDEVLIRMTLEDMRQNRVTMKFDYFKVTPGGNELAASGEQSIACMQREGGEMVPTPVPTEMREALRAYQNTAVGVV